MKTAGKDESQFMWSALSIIKSLILKIIILKEFSLPEKCVVLKNCIKYCKVFAEENTEKSERERKREKAEEVLILVQCKFCRGGFYWRSLY